MKSLRWCGFVFLVIVCVGCVDKGGTKNGEKFIEKPLPPLPSSPPSELLTDTGPRYTDLKGRDPVELLKEHLDGGNLSAGQRLYVRTFLARHHPTSTAGLFARAWLYDYSGDEGSALALYSACIAADPTLEACHQNFLSSLMGFMKDEPPEARDKAILKAWTAATAAIPEVVESSPGVFINVFSNLNDRERALTILKAEELRHPDLFVFDFMRGNEAVKAESHEDAESFFRSAAFNRRGTTPAVYRKLINHVYEHRSDRNLKPHMRLGPIVQEVLQKVTTGDLSPQVKARIFYDIALILKKRTNDKRSMIALLSMSFQAFPTEEAVLEIYDRFTTGGDPRGEYLALLKTASERLPERASFQDRLGNYHIRVILDPDKSLENFSLAMSLCKSRKECKGIADEFLWAHAIPLGRFGEFKALLGEHEAFRDNPQRLFEFRVGLYSGAYEAAGRALAQYEDELENANEVFFKARRARLAGYRQNIDRRQAHLDNNPFLRRWRKEMGQSVKLSIPFASGSAKVPLSSRADLERVSKMLERPDARNIIFAIEGHTDNVGDATRNRSLSLGRAQSVMKTFIDDFGLAPTQLRAVGYGEDFPIATNETAAGRTQNRRVEIVPIASLDNPSLAYTSNLDASYFDLSPDGRTMAVGSSPIELWDVERGVKVLSTARGATRRFSPDGRFVAAISNHKESGGSVFHDLFVFDTRTGQVELQVALQEELQSLAWDPFSRRIATTDNFGMLFVFDLNTGKRQVQKMGQVMISGHVLWSHDGARIYTAQAQSRILKVWNAETLALERSLTGINWVHALGRSRDGRYLVASDNTHAIAVWDTNDWSLRSVRIRGSIAKRLEAHPSLPLMALSLKFKEGVSLFDLKTMKIVGSLDLPSQGKAVFNPDGSRLFVGSKNSVSVRSVPDLKEQRTITGFAMKTLQTARDTRRGVLLVRNKAGIHAWDVETARQIHSWGFSEDAKLFETSKEGVFIVLDDNALVEINTEDFGRRSLPISADFDVQHVAVGERHIALGGVPEDHADGKTAVVDQGMVSLFERRTGAQIFTREIKITRAAMKYRRIYRSKVHVALDEDRGRVSACTGWQDGFGHVSEEGKEVDLMAMTTGEVQRVIKTRACKRVGFDDEGKVEVLSSGRLYRYEADTGKWLDSRAKETLLSSGDRMIYTSNQIERRSPEDELKGAASVGALIKHFEIFEARNLIVIADIAGRLVFERLDTFDEIVTVISNEDGEWLVFTPEGYFTASQAGTERVYWALGEDFLPFEALRKRYEDERRVTQALSAAMKPDPGPEKRVAEPIIEGDVFRPPYRLVVHDKVPEKSRKAALTLRYSIESNYKASTPCEVRFMVNGRAARGGVAPDQPLTLASVKKHRFDLAEGLNVIQISLRYKGIDVQTETVVTHRVATPRPAGSKVRLWYFGVGVSDYLTEGQDLTYAHADALAIERALKAQQGRLFSEVHTRVLTDGQAKAREIKIAMHEFLKQAAEDDVILVFIAGHGVQDNDQVLYFMAHDSDIKRPYTGFEVAEFRRFLQKRPLRQKAVFWLDICHAGSLPPSDARRRGSITAEDAIKLLSEGTGLSIMASSTGRESSLESKNYGGGHGAFTAALLEAIGGDADQNAGNNDGINTILEISTFVTRRVPEMTQGQQHPTLPSMENIKDFPLTRSVRP